MILMMWIYNMALLCIIMGVLCLGMGVMAILLSTPLYITLMTLAFASGLATSGLYLLEEEK